MDIDYQKKQQNNHNKLFLKNTGRDFIEYFKEIKARTMLSAESLYDLWITINYIKKRGLNGDIVEFGVWKGGSLELSARAIKQFNCKNRLIGIDTFSGHPIPHEDEEDAWGNNMKARYLEELEQFGSWAESSMDDVRMNLEKITSNFKLIKEEVTGSTTLSEIESIAILRLDMDWYDPTKAALENFFHRIQTGGSIIIDDYGHHTGAKKATDEFFRKHNIHLNFRHINYSCIAATVY